MKTKEATTNKTLFTILCPFCCYFCEERLIDVRSQKNAKNGRLYGAMRCGAVFRPTTLYSRDILKNEPVAVAIDEKIKSGSNEEKDYFEALGS